ncbi:hypothetical protein B0T14DRAFT_528299 [Immersiella caudata]|uniref:Uncharacterized protein n=1 Tax=Immersiella caudata TaxID=314043 RepID=A0AA39WF96_9PEZI|nr:hypothetical protein B0T14DRAFT_528299 [Immersiella caudata]
MLSRPWPRSYIPYPTLPVSTCKRVGAPPAHLPRSSQETKRNENPERQPQRSPSTLSIKCVW